MDKIFEKLSQAFKLARGQLTNSPLASTETVINACFDWYKFVFPFCSSHASIEDTKMTFNQVYDEIKSVNPELSDNDIFQMIQETYPGLKPKMNDYKNKNVLVSEDEHGVWSFDKIKTSIEHWFKLEEFKAESIKETIGSTRGFKFMQTYSPGICFCYDGPGMKFVFNGKTYLYKTCCFELKGEGCRKVEELGINLLEMLDFLYLIPGCHPTRCDFALDLINDDSVTFDYLIEKVCSKSFVGLYRKGSIMTSFDCSGDELSYSGITITFGSNSSTSKLNIYDKRAERFTKADVDVLVNSWIRFEVQLFNNKCENYVNALLDLKKRSKFDEFCFALLFKHLDIKICENLYKDPNFRPGKVKTWPTDPVWLNFMQRAGTVEIKSQQKLESDFTRTKKWYDRSVIGCQTFLDIFYKDSPEFKIITLQKEIDYLENKLDSNKLSILNQYRKKQFDLAPYSLDDVRKTIQDLKDEIKNLEEEYAIKKDV